MGAALLARPWRLAAALVGVWLVALSLALVGLGSLPLRDWDEGIVARVALEISRAPWPHTLLPTSWGEAYRNKPPGIHLLIAAVISLWRTGTGAAAEALPPEWVVRLAPALVSSLLAPLLALVQLRLRPGERGTALATAALALTLMPLVRHGRLAMLDGAQLVAQASLWWALLSAPAQQGAGLTAGLATSALLLLKAPAAAPMLLGALALRGLDRRLSGPEWRRLLRGLALGLLPGLAWHGLHGAVRGPDALAMWTSQGLARLGSSMEGHSGGPWPPLREVLKGGGPWLLLWPFGIAQAWRQRQQPWGRWALGLTLLAAGMVLPLRTQLPWYSLLLWPPFCLVCAPVLVALVRVGRPRTVPRFWIALGALLLLAFALTTGPWAASPLAPTQRLLQTALPPAALPLPLALGLGLTLGGALLLSPRQGWRRAGAATAVGGVALTLLLLLASPLWLWELNERWSVGPVVQLVNQHPLPAGVELRLWREGERPSLSWYLQRPVRPLAKGDPMPGDAGGVALLAAHPPSPPGWRCRQLGATAGIALHHCRQEEGPDPQPIGLKKVRPDANPEEARRGRD